MQAWAELVAAVLVGLVVAVLGAMGFDREPEDSEERRVRRVPVSTAAATLPPRNDPRVTMACDDTSGHA